MESGTHLKMAMACRAGMGLEMGMQRRWPGLSNSPNEVGVHRLKHVVVARGHRRIDGLRRRLRTVSVPPKLLMLAKSKVEEESAVVPEEGRLPS